MGGAAAGGLWRHQQWLPSWPPSWILPRIRNQVKTARNGNFLCFKWNITNKKELCMILATMFTLIVERSRKNSKLAWPPATYDVISRNHSNWPSLNLSQNLSKGWRNSYWKRQVLMLYPLGKKPRVLNSFGGRECKQRWRLQIAMCNVGSIEGEKIIIMWSWRKKMCLGWLCLQKSRRMHLEL